MILHNIKKILSLPLSAYAYYKLKRFSGIQKEFAKSLSFFKSNISKEDVKGILLIQMVSNYEYIVKFAGASKAISEKEKLAVNFYDVEINWIKSKPRFQRFKKLIGSSLTKICESFGGQIIFRNSEKYKDQAFIKNKLKEIIDRLDKDDPGSLFSLKFDNIEVGDLIYDTYLRFFHQPTIELIDEDVIQTIEVGLNVFYNFKSFLNSNNVKAMLNTYTSYIHHGIPARICLDMGIDVYTFGSVFYIIQKITKDFPYHPINHSLFSPDKKLSEVEINISKNIIESRFSGKIDSAISHYVKKSTYTRTPVNPELISLFQQKKRNIIIYVHDFYDSPHENRLLQFSDLYQFLKQVLDELTELTDTNVFVRPHPLGLAGCKEKTIDLVKSYGRNYFHIMDESVSNINIIELKPTLIVTARGTVGMEMSYFGIPVVALFDNLYTNFKFVHSCYDKQSYFALLKGEILPEIDFDKEKIYSFYYQAFLEKTAKEENNVIGFLQSFRGDTYSDEYLEMVLSSPFYFENRENLINYYLKAVSEEQIYSGAEAEYALTSINLV